MSAWEKQFRVEPDMVGTAVRLNPGGLTFEKTTLGSVAVSLGPPVPGTPPAACGIASA